MTALDYLTLFIGYLGAWLILYVASKALKTERKGLTVGPLYAIYRTRAFNKALERLSERKGLWRVLLNMAIALSIGQMIFILLSLTRNMIRLAWGVEGAYQLMLLLPGLTISWSSLPYILLSLAVLVISHEAAHGIATMVEGIPVKSSGIFLAVIVPGGFVELDEKRLEEAEPQAQLKIFSAGSAANLALGMVFLLLLMGFPYTLSPFYEPAAQGVIAVSIVEESGAALAGLTPGAVITSINGTEIRSTSDLMRYMRLINPDVTLVLSTDTGRTLLKTKPHPSNHSMGMIGIIPFEYYPPRFHWMPKQLPYHLYVTEYWMNTLLISIALINMLPLYPLDGGRVLVSILKMLKVKDVNRVRLLVSIFSAGILAANIILSMARFGLGKI
ncbi:MAG: site-2 protease family protein [Candidatus Bathyarchaeia archaeon]|nr:site-2 protease family protein [Candidatus Bathyarchaeota archaeon]